MSKEILYANEVFMIQGAIMEVYRVMGNGFLEEVYQRCLERELAAGGIPFDSKRRLDISYKGVGIGKIYIPDLVCYDAIILELKAVSRLTTEHATQLDNYLKVTGMRLGLLVNFGAYPGVEIKRWVNSRRR